MGRTHLVDAFNTTTSTEGKKEEAAEAKVEAGEDAEAELVMKKIIKSSCLRLSSDLRVQAKFGPMKSIARLLQKGAPDGVLDYVRAMVIFADPLLLALFYEQLAKQREHFTILQVKNKFVEAVHALEAKEGYITQPPNMHINLEFQGHVCEVQLTLEDFALIKEYNLTRACASLLMKRKK